MSQNQCLRCVSDSSNQTKAFNNFPFELDKHDYHPQFINTPGKKRWKDNAFKGLIAHFFTQMVTKQSNQNILWITNLLCCKSNIDWKHQNETTCSNHNLTEPGWDKVVTWRLWKAFNWSKLTDLELPMKLAVSSSAFHNFPSEMIIKTVIDRKLPPQDNLPSCLLLQPLISFSYPCHLSLLIQQNNHLSS